MAQPFVVPEGVVFLIEDDGVTIENQGDIQLHTDFGGRKLKRIVSAEGSIALHLGGAAGLLDAAGSITVGGSLEAASVASGGALVVAGNAAVGELRAASVEIAGNLSGGQATATGNVSVAQDLEVTGLHAGGDVRVGRAAVVGALHAGRNLEIGGNAQLAALHIGGDATFGGTVTAITIRASNVNIGGGTVIARGIQASTRVSVGPAKLTVDAILAPEVTLDARANGRVTVVESNNDLAESRIKGGFRLSDYAEMFGSVSAFLSERGLTSMDGDVPQPAVVQPKPVVAPPVVAVAKPIVAPPPPVVEVVQEPEEDEPGITVTVPAAPAPPSEPLSAEDPLASAPEHPIHPQLASTVQRIAECYVDGDVPDAVVRLADLVEGRRYAEIRSEITHIWSELLKHHQKKGIRIHHQVTTTFNSVNSLVKKM